jgi:hypothetical protein
VELPPEVYATMNGASIFAPDTAKQSTKTSRIEPVESAVQRTTSHWDGCRPSAVTSTVPCPANAPRPKKRTVYVPVFDRPIRIPSPVLLKENPFSGV